VMSSLLNAATAFTTEVAEVGLPRPASSASARFHFA
jgi:hypothetical protein